MTIPPRAPKALGLMGAQRTPPVEAGNTGRETRATAAQRLRDLEDRRKVLFAEQEENDKKDSGWSLKEAHRIQVGLHNCAKEQRDIFATQRDRLVSACEELTTAACAAMNGGPAAKEAFVAGVCRGFCGIGPAVADAKGGGA